MGRSDKFNDLELRLGIFHRNVYHDEQDQMERVTPPRCPEGFEQVSVEWIEKQGVFWDQVEQEGKDYSLKRENKIIPLSKEEDARWAAKVKPLLDYYVKNAKTKGPARRRGSQILYRLSEGK
jgi:hypothetical protein